MYLLDNLMKKTFIFGVLYVLFHVFIETNFLRNLLVILAAFSVTGNIFDLVWYFLPKRMLPDIQDKAVLITGCDTGFGYEFAKKLDSLGVLVFAGCLYSEGDGAKELKSSCSDKLKIIQLDVTQDEQVGNAVERVTSILQENKKELWAVVNNAGIIGPGEIEWTPIDVFQKIYDVNTLGQVRVTKAFLSLLKMSKGRVVNVISAAGYLTGPLMTSYSMSKHAAVSLSNGLRQELMKWSISVHTIEPWFYRTDMMNDDKIDLIIQKNWDNTAKKVQEEYGEGYVDKIKEIERSADLISRPRSAINEVVDALTHATVGRNPKLRYIPGLIGFLFTTASSILPTELFCTIIYIIFPKVNNLKSESKKLK
ncbi:estradiol 17-beta-dehydrogenase 2-like isoform X1 [Periplaneta americana]|uniref:estradiol 17-beta-dehydrogenase 2-like isoform X1 n=1 Tax=Periplaneta americana TaxID=6978 RepID=UPI0037E9103E